MGLLLGLQQAVKPADANEPSLQPIKRRSKIDFNEGFMHPMGLSQTQGYQRAPLDPISMVLESTKAALCKMALPGCGEILYLNSAKGLGSLIYFFHHH